MVWNEGILTFCRVENMEECKRGVRGRGVMEEVRGNLIFVNLNQIEEEEATETIS